MSPRRTRERPHVRLLTDELHRGPWVYGRQVRPPEDALPDGELVEVRDASERFVGHALYNGSSDVRLRFLSRGRRNALDRPQDFLAARLRAADTLRRKVLRLEEHTDTYRVVHAEGDDLSGLIVDRLGSVLVCEVHALGFHRLREELVQALAGLYPGFPVCYRVPPRAQRAEGFTFEPGPADRPVAETWIREDGLAYPVRPAEGHKTGWFCDQRENRRHVAALGRGRDVLDLCCNAGGFALQLARAGARRVRAVDLDEDALELARRAAERNGLTVQLEHADAFDVLRSVQAGPTQHRPGLVVLDPPKLIHGRAGLEEGRRKYGDLNTLALGAVRKGGLLATYSCSGALDLPSFLGLLFQSARRAEREVRLLETSGAGPDHPQTPDFPRSRYLKGALLAVD